MNAPELLKELRSRGCFPRLHYGPAEPEKHPPPPTLRAARVPEDLQPLGAQRRDALKAALLLEDPPGWLARMLAMCAGGDVTKVRRSRVSKTGKTAAGTTVEVSTTPETIAANIATAVGFAPGEVAIVAPLDASEQERLETAGLTPPGRTSARVVGEILPLVEKALSRVGEPKQALPA